MKNKCKHCGTRYTETNSSGPFCCSGCESVYALIQEGGLGGFYAQQNGVGRPMKDRAPCDSDFVFVRQLQGVAEQSEEQEVEAVLGVEGLTCFGCVWLVEHLATRREGIRFAKVALSSARVHLRWSKGEADLADFARELDDFGYSLKDASVAGLSVSPLLLRFLMTLMFSVNAAIIIGLMMLGLGGEGMKSFFSLLLILSLLFSLFVGGQVFFQPAWRAIQIARWHHDLVPVGVLTGLLVWTLGGALAGSLQLAPMALYFSLLNVLLLVRWVAEAWALRSN